MVTFTVLEHTFEAETSSDLFSPKALDNGTRLLLENIQSTSPSTILDWGCGWGAITLYLSKKYPKSSVTAIDSDIQAIKLTKQNVQRNNCANVAVFASHGYEEIDSNQKFELIVSHPPTHRGREVVEEMIEKSYLRLTEGGELYIVVEARLKPWVARHMKQVFGNCKIVVRSQKYVVLKAKK